LRPRLLNITNPLRAVEGAILGDGSTIVSEGLGRTILGDEIGRAISGGANIGNCMIVWAYVVEVCRRYFHCAMEIINARKSPRIFSCSAAKRGLRGFGRLR
jgi:hypothetical protein